MLADGGGARFRLWAPARRARRARASTGAARARRSRCEPGAGGWHELVADRAPAPAPRYAFRFDDGLARAGPGVALQPRGRARPERRGRPAALRLARRRMARPAVARGGDLRAARRHVHARRHVRRGGRSACADLAALGITAIELMPVADFPGRRNWGYDGVLPFAPDAAYGTPEELKRLVDAAHAPRADGAARRRLQPLRPRRQLPARVRAAVLRRRRITRRGARRSTSTAPQPHGARLLRAQRALLDRGIPPRRPAARRGARDARRLAPSTSSTRSRARCATGRGASATCTWCWRTTRNQASPARATRRPRCARRAVERRPAPRARTCSLTGETDGYYADYADAPLAAARPRAGRRLRLPGRAVGLPRRRARAASPAPQLPPTAFVISLQTHDQVGNRAFGERISRARRPAGALRRAVRLPAAVAARADAVHGRGVRRLARRSCSSAISAPSWPRP